MLNFRQKSFFYIRCGFRIRKEIEDTFKKRGEVSMEEVRDRKTGKKMRKIEGGPTIPVEDI